VVKVLGSGFKEGIILQHEEADWEEDFIVGDIAEFFHQPVHQFLFTRFTGNDQITSFSYI